LHGVAGNTTKEMKTSRYNSNMHSTSYTNHTNETI